jgi:hypothetical protein
MKRFLMIAAVMFVVSVPVLAGNIPTVGITAPPPPEVPQSGTSPGEIPSVPGEITIVGDSVVTSDPSLNLIQMIVSLIL